MLIAGSTWAEDEQLLASVLPILPPDWKLVIVPHEVDEERISYVEKLFAGRIRRWSALQENTLLNQQVLVVDTIGLLLKIYRYGSIAWIGGGLEKGGIHNVLEAAVYGLPCAHGPVHEKYQEAVELIVAGASTVCSNQQELQQFVRTMIEDKRRYAQASAAAKNYVFAQSGATEIILNYLAAKNWLSTL